MELRGKLDCRQAKAFKDVIQQAVARGEKPIVIDLSDVTYVGAVPMAEMFRATNENHTIQVVGSSPQIQTELALGGVLHNQKINVVGAPKPFLDEN